MLIACYLAFLDCACREERPLRRYIRNSTRGLKEILPIPVAKTLEGVAKVCQANSIGLPIRYADRKVESDKHRSVTNGGRRQPPREGIEIPNGFGFGCVPAPGRGSSRYRHPTLVGIGAPVCVRDDGGTVHRRGSLSEIPRVG